jgi:hypothetical protein
VEVKTGIKREDASQELQHAIERAHEGDEAALLVIREHLAARDDGYWRLMDYARVVQSGQVRRYIGPGLFPQEVIKERIKRLRKELQGPEPSPLEDLLIERIISCWLHVNYAEDECAGAAAGDVNLDLAEYKQKRLDRAHRRYISAVKALAQIRKMGPAVQINIARKQVNVAGAPTTRRPER